MQIKKLKTCAKTAREATHGVYTYVFLCVRVACVYIYNPQDLYYSPKFKVGERVDPHMSYLWGCKHSSVFKTKIRLRFFTNALDFVKKKLYLYLNIVSDET